MLDTDIPTGLYVVAVSGGVDSMVLLDVLQKSPHVRVIVAHYDHGIRHDSKLDRQLVQQTAKVGGHIFVYDEGNLGSDTSEAQARKARYEFLQKIRRASGARGIITAHHQDDVLENAIIQFMRGAGRKSWSSLRSSNELVRPLRHIPKQDLVNYASQNGIKWREDSTNTDTKYLRNYVRANLLPKFEPAHKQAFLQHIQNLEKLNREIDEMLTLQLHIQPHRSKLDRRWFIGLPYKVSTEVMAQWLRSHGIRQFDKRMIDRLTVAAKTFRPEQKTDIGALHYLEVHKTFLALKLRDR